MRTIDDYTNIEDYEVELIKDYDADFIEMISRQSYKYSISKKELSSNYTHHRFKVAIKNDKRFQHGYCFVKHRNRLVLSFGLDDFQGWGVISRYLRHTDENDDTSLFVPIGYGVAFPFVMKNLNDSIVGLCSTQNIKQRDLMGMIFKRYTQYSDREDMLGAAARLIRRTRKLPYTVWYRNCEQSVFVYNNDLNPPFKKL